MSQVATAKFEVLEEEVKEQPQAMAAARAEMELVEMRGVDWSIGPITISASLADGGVRAEVKLLGQTIAEATLTPGNATVGISKNILVAKVELTLRADFAKTELWASGRACVRAIPSWRCVQFNQRIFDW